MVSDEEHFRLLRALVYSAGGEITVPDHLLAQDGMPPLTETYDMATMSTTYRVRHPRTLTVHAHEREGRPALPATKGK